MVKRIASLFFKQDQITSRYGGTTFSTQFLYWKTVQKVKNGEDLFETKLCLGINKSIISVLHGMKKNFLIVRLMDHQTETDGRMLLRMSYCLSSQIQW